jgi:hypothetical protein
VLYQLSYTPKPAEREARMPLALSENGRTRPGHGSIRRRPASQPPKAVSEHQRHPLGDHQVVFAGIPQVNIGIRDMAEADAEPETVVKAQAAAKKRRNS